MFTESGEIGVVALKASTLFEKELCDSLKQASISDFFKNVKYILGIFNRKETEIEVFT